MIPVCKYFFVVYLLCNIHDVIKCVPLSLCCLFKPLLFISVHARLLHFDRKMHLSDLGSGYTLYWEYILLWSSGGDNCGTEFVVMVKGHTSTLVHILRHIYGRGNGLG